MFISYAQNFEDVMLWRALKHVKAGFYIDIGAAWPKQHSVTKAFYDAGWRGINIEPNTEFLALLQDDRPADINLDLALSDRVGQQPIYIIESTGLSTLDSNIVATHEAAGLRSRKAVVQVSTLSEIWRTHVGSRDVHFVKIDVEGLEGRVLAGNDWHANRPWIVVVEATIPMSPIRSHEQWESIILEANYRFAYEDGLNRFYVSSEHSELCQALVSPPNVFDKFVPARQVDAEAQARRAKARVQAAESVAEEARAQVLQLQCQIEQAETAALAAEARADSLKRKMKLIEETFSWRLTRPLRWAGSVIRRLLRLRSFH